MRRTDFDEIEFRFFKFGGHAKGRFAVFVFAVLITLAMITTIVICLRVSTTSTAFYDHLDDPQSRTVTIQTSPSP